MKINIVEYEKRVLNLDANVGDEVEISKEQMKKLKDRLKRSLKIAKKHKNSDPVAKRDYDFIKKRLEYLKGVEQNA